MKGVATLCRHPLVEMVLEIVLTTYVENTTVALNSYSQEAVRLHHVCIYDRQDPGIHIHQQYALVQKLATRSSDSSFEPCRQATAGDDALQATRGAAAAWT